MNVIAEHAKDTATFMWRLFICNKNKEEKETRVENEKEQKIPKYRKIWGHR